MAEHENFVDETPRREHLAEEAFYIGNPEPFKDMRSHADDVSLFGAFAPAKTGWPEVSRTFDWVASRYRDGSVTSEYEVVYEGTDLTSCVFNTKSLTSTAGSRCSTSRATAARPTAPSAIESFAEGMTRTA